MQLYAIEVVDWLDPPENICHMLIGIIGGVAAEELAQVFRPVICEVDKHITGEGLLPDDESNRLRCGHMETDVSLVCERRGDLYERACAFVKYHLATATSGSVCGVLSRIYCSVITSVPTKAMFGLSECT